MCSALAPLRPSAIPIKPRVFPRWVCLLVLPQHLPGTPLQPNGQRVLVRRRGFADAIGGARDLLPPLCAPDDVPRQGFLRVACVERLGVALEEIAKARVYRARIDQHRQRRDRPRNDDVGVEIARVPASSMVADEALPGAWLPLGQGPRPIALAAERAAAVARVISRPGSASAFRRAW
jgi:hypothetical protein